MVRNFESRAVPRETLERILENALHAPSAGFSQGWAFLLLCGPEQTERFWNATFVPGERAAFRWPGLFKAPAIIVPFAHQQAYLERYAEPDKGWTDRDASRWPTPYWHVDTACATMLMLLTATDAELGALFFAVFAIDAVRAAFDVPSAYHPIGAIALGYPAPDEPSRSLQRGRRPLSEVLHEGNW